MNYYIFFVLLFIHFSDKGFFNHKNNLESEIEKHFKEMMNSAGQFSIDIREESNFPQTTAISPSKIEIDTGDENLFFIFINLNEVIKPENIVTERGNNYIKIDINFDQSYYQIILKDNEVSIASESNRKIKNTQNTKYAQSSSHMSRKEKLSRYIDLNTVKVKVNSQDKTIHIMAKYINNKKDNNIDIEFK